MMEEKLRQEINPASGLPLLFPTEVCDTTMKPATDAAIEPGGDNPSRAQLAPEPSPSPGAAVGAEIVTQPEPTKVEPAQAGPAQVEPRQSEQTPAQQPKTELPQAKQSPKPQTREEIDLTFTEAARNQDEYIDYVHERYEGEDGASVHLFAARRIGLSHIRKQTPCQDACGIRRIAHGCALLNADGISACKFGEVGSQLACEAAGDEIERLSRETPDEDEFIRTFMSEAFYRNVRQAWIQRVGAHCEAQGGQMDDHFVFDYGTTLLIAVLTKRWIATLNLGDGQILLYNEGECQYLRLAEKESPAPKSLIYGTYLEDVQRGLWPRARYRGVLLTTDGVNDLLDKIPSFEGRSSAYNYALQIESRFMENGEPYQPFVYTGVVLGQKRTIDLSRQRGASDDCSIVLAVDEGYKPCDEGVVEALKRRYGAEASVQLLRRVGEKAGYVVSIEGVSRMVLQTPASKLLAMRSPRLRDFTGGAARAWRYEDRWVNDGRRFSAYRLQEGVEAQTLEAEFQCAAFNTVRQYHKTEDPKTGEISYVVEPLLGESVLRVADALSTLEDHLAAQNLYFNETAPSWIVMQEDGDGTLLVPEEVLSEHPAAQDAPWQLTFGQLFPGLIGWLKCGERRMPLFAPGGDILDVNYYLFNAKRDNEKAGRFFRVLYNPAQKAYGLMNNGENRWSVVRADGQAREVEPGKVVVLKEGDRIDVMKDGAKLFSCTAGLR